MALKNMSRTVRDEASRPISFAASITYLVSAIFSLTNSLFSVWSIPAVTSSSVGLPSIPEVLHSLPLRIIVFLFLESCLAYVFALGIAWLFRRGEGIFFVLQLISGFVAAWTSLFNVQWLLLLSKPGRTTEQAIFLAGALLSLAVGVYFLHLRWGWFCGRAVARGVQMPSVLQSQERSLIGMRVVTFAVMYGLLLWISLAATAVE